MLEYLLKVDRLKQDRSSNISIVVLLFCQ